MYITNNLSYVGITDCKDCTIRKNKEKTGGEQARDGGGTGWEGGRGGKRRGPYLSGCAGGFPAGQSQELYAEARHDELDLGAARVLPISGRRNRNGPVPVVERSGGPGCFRSPAGTPPYAAGMGRRGGTLAWPPLFLFPGRGEKKRSREERPVLEEER